MYFVLIFSIVILFFSYLFYGGGGVGGWIVVYFRSNRIYSGVFEFLGGDFIGDVFFGGVGIVFLYYFIYKYCIFLISNVGRKVLFIEYLVIKDYFELVLILGKIWFLFSFGEYNFLCN